MCFTSLLWIACITELKLIFHIIVLQICVSLAEPPNPMVTPAQVIASLGGSSNLTCTVEIPLGDAALEWVMVMEKDIDSIDTNLTCTTGSSGAANTNTQEILDSSQRLNSSRGVLQLTAIDYETAGYYVCVFESMSVTTCFSDIVSVAGRCEWIVTINPLVGLSFYIMY